MVARRPRRRQGVAGVFFAFEDEGGASRVVVDRGGAALRVVEPRAGATVVLSSSTARGEAIRALSSTVGRNRMMRPSITRPLPLADERASTTRTRRGGRPVMRTTVARSRPWPYGCPSRDSYFVTSFVPAMIATLRDDGTTCRERSVPRNCFRATKLQVAGSVVEA